MYQLLVVLSLVAGAFAGGMCPMIKGKFPYDETKVVGEWHVISGQNLPGRCGKMVYEPTGDLHTVHYTAQTPDGKPLKLDIIGEYFGKGDKKSANAVAVMKTPDGNISPPFHQGLVETDYKNHAVLIGCSTKFDAKNTKFVKHVKAAILSRTKTLSPEVLATLKSIVASYDIPNENMKDVDHANC